MITVYKYKASCLGAFSLELPEWYEILHYGIQDGSAYIWVKVDTDDDVETVRFHAYGTGWPIGDSDKDFHIHVGTVITDDGFVWHLFELWDIA